MAVLPDADRRFWVAKQIYKYPDMKVIFIDGLHRSAIVRSQQDVFAKLRRRCSMNTKAIVIIAIGRDPYAPGFMFPAKGY